MDRNLVALKPALVWKHFAEIVRIPRPSSHEEKIRRYILDFARAQGLESKEDAAHNVYVRKPASKGMEDRKGVILQAHLDMVPQKNNDKEFDFTKDPIDAYIDGGWVTADGTTLGADNGIGVAAILAVLEDRTLKHGPLEALFTATEETGMDGANGLEKGLLHGDILLNLDSGGGGRTLRGLRRRARRQYDLRLQGRADARGRLYRCEDQRQGAQGRPFGHPDRLPARQRQQGAVPLFECRAVRRAAGVGGRRRTPQRHPARGRGRGAGRNRGLRRVRRCGESLRGDRKGRIRRYRGRGVGQGRGGRETGRNAAEGGCRKSDQGRCGLPRRGAADVGGHARAGADLDEPRTRGVGRQDGETPMPAAQLGQHREGGAGRVHRRPLRAGRGQNGTHGRLQRLEPRHGVADPEGHDRLPTRRCTGRSPP